MAEYQRKTIGNLYIIQVDSSPILDPVDAPIGSLALLDNGAGGIWHKTNIGDTNWEPVLIGTGTPMPITNTNSEGNSTSAARSDHTHQGIHAVRQNAAPYQYGDITLANGSGINITDNGNGTFTFSTSSISQDLLVTNQGGLNAHYAAGRINVNGIVYDIPTGSLSLPPSVTDWTIYVNEAGSVLATATLPPLCVPLAHFSTDSTSITELSDKRVSIDAQAVFGLSNEVQTIGANSNNLAGSTRKYAQVDHTHNINTATTIALPPNSTSQEGSSNALARADHTHATPTGIAVAISANSTNSEGTANTYARSDHTHNIITAEPVALTPDSGNVIGINSALSRADHKHNIPCSTPVTLTAGTTNSEGVAESLARADHVHQLQTSTAISISTTNTEGTNNSLARADHTHRGIASLKQNIASPQYGDITLLNGIGITIDNTGGNFTISADIPKELFPTYSGSGLNVAYTGGKVLIDGTIHTITAGNITLPQSVNNYWLFVNSTGSVAFNSTLPPLSVPIAQFTTDTINVTSLIDKRVSLDTNSVAGSTGEMISGLSATTINSAGNVEKYARIDHAHDIVTGNVITQTPNNANSEGTSSALARADHTHFIPVDFPNSLTPDSGNLVGTASSFSRSDHTHNITCEVAVSVGTTNSEGTALSFSRSDHVHRGVSSFQAETVGTPRYGTITLKAGTRTSIVDNADGSFTINDTSSFGVTPQTVGTTNQEGTSTSFARADHIHAHGNQGGGLLHSLATTSLAGFMSPEDKLKLDSYPTSPATMKAGIVSSGSFSGNPKKATVTFSTAFASANYSITISGIDARTFTYESKTASGFVINANANTALTGEVSWMARTIGE